MRYVDCDTVQRRLTTRRRRADDRQRDGRASATADRASAALPRRSGRPRAASHLGRHDWRVSVDSGDRDPGRCLAEAMARGAAAGVASHDPRRYSHDVAGVRRGAVVRGAGRTARCAASRRAESATTVPAVSYTRMRASPGVRPGQQVPRHDAVDHSGTRRGSGRPAPRRPAAPAAPSRAPVPAAAPVRRRRGTGCRRPATRQRAR